MKKKKLLNGLGKAELARMAEDILVKLEEQFAPEWPETEYHVPYEGHARRNFYRGIDDKQNLKDRRRLQRDSRTADNRFRLQRDWQAADGRSGPARDWHTADDRFSRGDLSDDWNLTEYGAWDAALSDDAELYIREEEPTARKQALRRTGARRGTVGSELSESPGQGREAEVLTEHQVLGQSRLPERLSERFCRDARRYDGSFERY